MTNQEVSKTIVERIKNSGSSFAANDNVAEFIKEGEVKLLTKEVEKKVKELMECLLIDVDNDPNSKDTPKRIAKMYVQEVFNGRYSSTPKTTDFPNTKSLNEMYILGPISLKSACSHHFVPILGSVWVGILPSDRIIGISKFNRLVDWIMSRPHIQEESAIMLADLIEEKIKPKGLALLIKGQHYCMKWRGVKDPKTVMTNVIMRGEFKKSRELKQEFYDLIKGHKFEEL